MVPRGLPAPSISNDVAVTATSARSSVSGFKYLISSISLACTYTLVAGGNGPATAAPQPNGAPSLGFSASQYWVVVSLIRCDCEPTTWYWSTCTASPVYGKAWPYVVTVRTCEPPSNISIRWNPSGPRP